MFNIEKKRKKRCASGTDHWISTTPRLLVFNPHASKRIREYIGWLRTDFPENRREQGGLLIGKYTADEEGNPYQAEVMDVLLAKTEHRFPGYIEWDAMEGIRLQQEFFKLKEDLETEKPEEAENLKIIGWWHTHPNKLPVWMSATDMETQRLEYYKPEKYSVVLNPHTGIWRAYAGRDAEEVPAIMLLDEV